MSGSQHNATDMGTGADRAAEVNESFLGIPGYADDTFFFVIRYVEKAKRTLRQSDFEAFMRSLHNIDDAAQLKGMTPAARAEKMREHRSAARALVDAAGNEELSRDFDVFLTKSKALRKSMSPATGEGQKP